MMNLQPIGYVRSPYAETAQIPKGLGAVHQAEGTLELLPQFAAGLTDIEGFSHLYVIWVFDRAGGYEPVGTPPTDNRPHGVFATRSPRRPNPIGLTVVTLVKREGSKLHVRGVDMLDGTRSWISNPTFRVFPPMICAVDGWRKPRRGKSRKIVSAQPIILHDCPHFCRSGPLKGGDFRNRFR